MKHPVTIVISIIVIALFLSMFSYTNPRIKIANEHKECSSNKDCVGIAVGCSECMDDCDGINANYAGLYDSMLDCSYFKEPRCGYKCAEKPAYCYNERCELAPN